MRTNLKVKPAIVGVDVSAEQIVQILGRRYTICLWVALDTWLPWHLWAKANRGDEEAAALLMGLKMDVQFWLGAGRLSTKGGARTWTHLHAKLGQKLRDLEPSED